MEQLETFRITIPGRPVPAVRMTQRGKFVKRDAGRYLRYKNEIAWAAKAEKMRQGLETIEGPVEVTAVFYLYGKREGDLDNLGKSAMDGMNGVIWVDDRQVRRLTLEKVTVDSEEEQRAEIEVRAYVQHHQGNDQMVRGR